MRPLVSDRELRACVARALDPGDEAALTAAIALDPTAPARLAAIRARLERPAAPAWFVPRRTSEGLPLPPLARIEPVAYLGGATARGEVWTEVRIELPAAEAARVRPVVVVERADGGEVVHPEAEEDWLALDRWPSRNGGYALLVMVPEEDLCRVVVALPEEGFPVDWTAPPERRWVELREAVAEGAVRAAVVRR